jgi:hypothetical protein
MKLALRLVLIVAAIALLWFAVARIRIGPVVEAVAPVTNSSDAQRSEPSGDLQTPAGPPRAESARQAVPTFAPEVAGPKQVQVTATLLRVHVVARETQKPLVGRRLTAFPRGVMVMDAETLKSATTGFDGRAEFEVEPAHEIVLDLDDHAPITVAALTAGEQRDVEIELPTEEDLTVLGRLLDADTNKSIGGGTLWHEAALDKARRQGLVSPAR